MAQEFEVLRDERLPFLLVALKEGKHQQISETVRIAVERASVNMGNGQPFPLKGLGDGH